MTCITGKITFWLFEYLMYVLTEIFPCCSNAMATAASGVHQGHPIPQGHLGPVVNRGQEDHLHSPASGYNLTAAQQPPWVR